MPRYCCVSKCSSNVSKSGDYVSVYRFPNKDDVKEKWIKNIQRQNWVPSKDSVVCSKHFRKCDFTSVSTSSNKRPCRAGKVIKFPRIKPDAVPTIFNDYPLSLRPKLKACRVVPSDRQNRIINHLKLQEKLLCEKNKIKSLDDFVNRNCNWNYLIKKDVAFSNVMEELSKYDIVTNNNDSNLLASTLPKFVIAAQNYDNMILKF